MMMRAHSLADLRFGHEGKADLKANFPSIVDGRQGDLGFLPNHRLSLVPGTWDPGPDPHRGPKTGPATGSASISG